MKLINAFWKASVVMAFIALIGFGITWIEEKMNAENFKEVFAAVALFVIIALGFYTEKKKEDGQNK